MGDGLSVLKWAIMQILCYICENHREYCCRYLGCFYSAHTEYLPLLYTDFVVLSGYLPVSLIAVNYCACCQTWPSLQRISHKHWSHRSVVGPTIFLFNSIALVAIASCTKYRLRVCACAAIIGESDIILVGLHKIGYLSCFIRSFTRC